MNDITLQQLLEAGCHFGHKAERWNPKAVDYIYTEKDGIHIIDLAKTKEGLDRACLFVSELVATGGEVLFVGTKRQAKEIMRAEAGRVGAPFVVERWIGGFLTNWEGIQRTIKKILTMTEEEKNGAWKKFPKHERVKLSHHLKRLNMFYGGVTNLMSPPKALFIVDVKKENVAFREAVRCSVPMIAIVDTNVNPTEVVYPIPANDDAVGSIAIITKAIADAYEEGKRKREKGAGGSPEEKSTEPVGVIDEKKIEKPKTETLVEEKKNEPEKAKRRGRPALTRTAEVSVERTDIQRGRPKKVVS
ncbi:MAG: 30S ribosomal protein S2 [Candidatus Gottesmanbacteria bacterium GW2011_GWA2_44_17]|uniref:Small ribosomal subunit protein uS2 n=2 Tax=Candidatus Gottesmaniibacteriota TaxID=1752720 RepID=A0A0G1JSK6_9BACT|nr:MAG: 30S ribosomal protein S2 [Microgenomates group bacterium GW2011_GWC1_43_11]KKT36163.1 MAG: 30S ribosomal protein S2 [Candidatus Gottesmanbacteria bacterium GW2011_GWB1_44_11c]KKT46887.1 MAG: 30S ribosomal protein S2 [Candidatus Gottesmanbacteria bacterium GW2011_GWA2_44_17]